MIENSAGWRYVQSADPVADYPTVSEHNAGKFQYLKSTVDGLDTSLAGKAPRAHTHSTSQVTGLDTSLAGKAPLATLNTRVPENLALRLDTTVGTRIFAGTTMIHGDTGWREISGLMTENFSLWGVDGPPENPSIHTFLRIKRAGSTVTLEGRIGASSLLEGVSRSQVSVLSDSIPTVGFRPHRDYILAGQYWSYASGQRGVIRAHNGTVELREASGTWGRNELVIVHASWEAGSTWPATLPGLPG